MTDSPIAAAFVAACDAELEALKPGNVHVFARGHGMTVDDFRLSARAAAGPLTRMGDSLGTRVLGAVSATRDAVGQNTNLGIVLLCAPIAMGAEWARAGWTATIRTGVARAIAGAGVIDADAVFRAIAMAGPAGLGEVPEHNVRASARIGLRSAMEAAAGRDSIAACYAHDLAPIFEIGLPALREARLRWKSRKDCENWAVTACYLTWLAGAADGHIIRKHGSDAAAHVLVEARARLAALQSVAEPSTLHAPLLDWDTELKRGNINPGSSADLVVATLFADRLG